MRCRNPFFFLLTIAMLHLLFHTHPSVSAPAATSTLIQKTCKKTKYYDLCVSSLKSDPTSPAADTKGLAVIMVGVAIANANATSSFLSSLVVSTSGGGDPTMGKLLKDCADKYALAAGSLQDSLQDLAMETYDYAYLHISGAQDYPNACHNAFKRAPGRTTYPPEVARREDNLKRICDVALGIVDVLASQ